MRKSSAIRKFCVTLLVLTFTSASALGDLRIKRRETRPGSSEQIESVIYLKGSRQRTERTLFDQAKGREQLVVVWIDQCDQKQFIYVNPMAKEYSVQVGWSHLSEVMAFGEMQMKPAKQTAIDKFRAQSKGSINQTTTVIDTGERRDMFGFTARHLKTIITWDADPKSCDASDMKREIDGWYIDLLYGIDCSPDLSGSIQGGMALPSSKCFNRYLKEKYWIDNKRVGPASPGFPLIEETTYYSDKGVPLITRNEVVEISNEPLGAALFEPPAGFALVEFKTKPPRRSILGRVFSFL